jgi:uncharacterized protein (DUF1697 family)
VSLLRGINVGGANRVAMPALRAVYEGLGATRVTTYLQSGNVILASADGPDDMSIRAAAAIERELGLRISVLGRGHPALERVVQSNPYPGVPDTSHHVVFLAGPISPAGLSTLERLTSEGEAFVVVDGELHLYQPNGLGRSKLGQALTERQLGVVPTARNWRTVVQLSELSRPQP